MSIERQYSFKGSRQTRPASDRLATRKGVRWLAFAAGAVFAVGAVADNDSSAKVANEAAIKKVFADYARPGQPGCSVGVMRNGSLQHASAYGLADLDQRKPLDTNSIFNIASISKQFTAFSILLLDQRKSLSLDDPLIKYVPELSASAKGVTLRHLVHHMGGLRDYTALLMMRGRRMSDGATQFETIDALGQQRGVNFAPATQYAYSNTGYVLLATVIERVSGRSMKQFAAENIFGPLGMKQTTIIDRYPSGLPKLARGYTPGKQGFDVNESAWEQVGDGQVHTTAADLLLWAENFHSGRAGGLPLMQRMTQVGVLKSGEKLDYAAGLAIGEHNGLPTVSHGGGWAAYRSHLLMFPQQHFAVSVLCNRDDVRPHQLASAVAEIYLAEEMRRTGKKSAAEDREPPAAPAARWQPAKLADYEGVYWSDEAQARCVLVQRGGSLYVEGCMPGYELQAGDDKEFYSADAMTRLQLQMQAGKPSGFTLHSYGLNGLAFTRQQTK
jgi:CubicO group peptidase (beta-lactamase class C family)